MSPATWSKVKRVSGCPSHVIACGLSCLKHLVNPWVASSALLIGRVLISTCAEHDECIQVSSVLEVPQKSYKTSIAQLTSVWSSNLAATAGSWSCSVEVLVHIKKHEPLSVLLRLATSRSQSRSIKKTGMLEEWESLERRYVVWHFRIVTNDLNLEWAPTSAFVKRKNRQRRLQKDDHDEFHDLNSSN